MGNAPCRRDAQNAATASVANNSSSHVTQEPDLCILSCRCTQSSKGIDPLEAVDEPTIVEMEQELPHSALQELPCSALWRPPGQPPAIALAERSRARAVSRQRQPFGEFEEEEEKTELKTNNQFGFATSYHAASGPLLDLATVTGQLQPLIQLGRLYSLEATLTRRPSTQNPIVTLNIYDIGTSSVGQALNSVLRHFGTGAFHCGVEVHGCEWSFSDTEDGCGMGVFCSRPKLCDGHTYCQSVKMGRTAMTQTEVLSLVHLLSSYWPVGSYNTLTRNCCHFCDDMCQRLCVGPIPSWIMNLAGAGAALAATGDATCCREVAREVVGHSVVDKICCVAPGLSGDVILYHL